MRSVGLRIVFFCAALTACEQPGGSPSTSPVAEKDHYAMALALAPSVTYAIPQDLETDCYFGESVVLNGSQITAYLSSSVPFGESCMSETRYCSDGMLSGSYNYSSCQVQAPASCLFNGETIAHGQSVQAYNNSSAGLGEECIFEMRTCNNGLLSGSYNYATCSIDMPASCLFNGQTIAHGASVPAFLTSSVNYGETCQLEYRTCEDGVLSGSNTFATCEVSAAASCLFDGKTIAHGESVNAFLNSSVSHGNSCSVESRVCNNGVLSGAYQYSSCSVNQPASCLFNGQTIAHGETVSAFLNSSVAYGEMCSVETRMCDNGHLSGTYSYSSCDAGQPNSCLFNGQTIAHGASVTAFESSTVSSGSTCNSENRICNNGNLSGSFSFASCEANQPASCLFNGQTIVHGQKVIAYKKASAGNSNACDSEYRECNNGVLSGSYSYKSCESKAHNPHEDDDDTIKICKHVVAIKHKQHYSRHPNNGLHLGWYKYKERFNCGKHKGWYKHKNKHKHPKCNDQNKWYKHKQ
jgi:hypothetical protein